MPTNQYIFRFNFSKNIISVKPNSASWSIILTKPGPSHHLSAYNQSLCASSGGVRQGAAESERLAPIEHADQGLLYYTNGGDFSAEMSLTNVALREHSRLIE